MNIIESLEEIRAMKYCGNIIVREDSIIVQWYSLIPPTLNKSIVSYTEYRQNGEDSHLLIEIEPISS